MSEPPPTPVAPTTNPTKAPLTTYCRTTRRTPKIPELCDAVPRTLTLRVAGRDATCSPGPKGYGGTRTGQTNQLLFTYAPALYSDQVGARLLGRLSHLCQDCLYDELLHARQLAEHRQDPNFYAGLARGKIPHHLRQIF